MAQSTLFRGSTVESLDLIAAIAHQCGGPSTQDGQQCTFDQHGARQTRCAAHSALSSDQRFLNGILWMRRIVRRLLVEEFAEPRPGQPLLPYPGVNRGQCSCGRC